MLTDRAVRAAGAKDKAYKLTDRGGLFLHISPRNHKSWRFTYRLQKKEQLLTLGSYPEVSLATAREKRDEARKVLREGRDPRHTLRQAKLVAGREGLQTLEQMAREWHALQLKRWKEVHADDVITSLERDAIPDLGTMPLAVLRKVEQRGAIETARRVEQRVAAVYRYANAHGAKLENPSDGINDALIPTPVSADSWGDFQTV